MIEGFVGNLLPKRTVALVLTEISHYFQHYELNYTLRFRFLLCPTGRERGMLEGINPISLQLIHFELM